MGFGWYGVREGFGWSLFRAGNFVGTLFSGVVIVFRNFFCIGFFYLIFLWDVRVFFFSGTMGEVRFLGKRLVYVYICVLMVVS